MEERLHQRVDRPGRSGRGGRERAPACAHRACRTRTGRSARSSSSARPASARPSSRARSRSSCSTTTTRWCASTCRSTRSGTPSRGSSARRPATSATTRAASSPRRCGAGRTPSSCSTRSRRRTREVFDVLLQVLDDGRLTDGQGRTVDFRNTVLIMTSNIRSAEQLRERFRPEFLNRIDEIVEFKRAVARSDRRDRRAPARAPARTGSPSGTISLELTDAAKEALAEAGWDPAYGARPLKRAIQRLVENPLALRLLEGDFADGDTIRVDALRRRARVREGRRRRLRPPSEPISPGERSSSRQPRREGRREEARLDPGGQAPSPRSFLPRSRRRSRGRAFPADHDARLPPQEIPKQAVKHQAAHGAVHGTLTARSSRGS